MGLDMYLTAEKYNFTDWNNPAKDKKKADQIKKIFGMDKDLELGRCNTAIFDVMYWRKANAIHKWFVDNVQDGEDECKKTSVSIEQLDKLLLLVKEVLKNPKKAKDLLPCQEGFFFGGKEYGEWYFDSLKETKKVLGKFLKDKEKIKGLDIYYHSSW